MTSNVRRVIREPLPLQRLRRKYRQQQGTYRKTFLAAVNGSVLGTKVGHLWVHDAASANSLGNVTYGAPYQLPIKPGATIAHRPNWRVNVVSIEGVEYIESMDFEEMVRANFDPHQTNQLDPSLQYPLIENLQNLQAFPNGNATIRIMPGIYRKADGTFAIFKAIDVDILTGNVPSAGNQVVVCVWLKTDNTTEVTVSSEEPVSTLLKQDTTTALTLINECAAAATAGAMGIWSFIVYDTTTAITGANKFHDLRGIVGMGGTSSSSGTSGFGASTTKTLSSDTFAAGDDRNIVVAAETGTTDELIEITGLSVGDKILLRADAGDTITVKHNDAGATIKILIQDDADFVLDEVHPLELVLVETNQLVQVYDENSGGGGGAPTDAKYVTVASDGTLSNEVVISGIAGQLGVHSTGGGGISEEYNTSSTGLTWNSAPAVENSNQAYGTGKPSSLFVSVTGTTVYVGTRAFAPAGAYEAICQLEMVSNNGAAAGSGVFFYIGNAGDTSRTIIGISRSATNNYGVFAYTYASSTFTQRGTTIPLGGTMHGFFKMTRDGSNNVSFYWSSNGYNWLLIATQAFTFTVATIGYLFSTGASLTYGLYSDFLRTNV